MAIGRPDSAAKIFQRKLHETQHIGTHRQPSSSCCRSHFDGNHMNHERSSCGLSTTASMSGRSRLSDAECNSPTLMPARLSAESFSTVLVFGPTMRVMRRQPDGAYLRTNRGDDRSLVEVRSSLDVARFRVGRTLRKNLVSGVGTGAVAMFSVENHSTWDRMPS